jgi:hypothetical protein
VKYRDFIESYFFIDEPSTGKLVPFKFNKVQIRAYETLNTEYGIEKSGLLTPIRELFLKARREGFTSFILALFAADQILNSNPTNALEVSYKDDATKQHFKRYKNFLISYFQSKNIKDLREVFNTDNKHEIVLRAWKDGKEVPGPTFYVGTASAKTGERGGTLQKLLFTEAAFYPNTDIMTAKEIINATLRQVDISAGWVFIESTGKKGTEYERMWRQAEAGMSRFRPRFYGWREFYTEEEFKKISSEFTDPLLLKQEYPEKPDDAFVTTSSPFTTVEKIKKLVFAQRVKKRLVGWMELNGKNYITQAELIKAYLIGLETKYHDRELFIGIDVAKSPDSTVVTVLMGNEYSKDGIRGIAIDSTGAGDFLPDWIERNSRWPVQRVKLTAQQNDILYKLLTQVIENQQTQLPTLGEDEESRRFLEQMLNLTCERKGDLIVVEAPHGLHDDYADSWALAEFCYVAVMGLPESKPTPSEDEEEPELEYHQSPVPSTLNQA